jgi:hypothetical protein
VIFRGPPLPLGLKFPTDCNTARPSFPTFVMTHQSIISRTNHAKTKDRYLKGIHPQTICREKHGEPDPILRLPKIFSLSLVLVGP